MRASACLLFLAGAAATLASVLPASAKAWLLLAGAIDCGLTIRRQIRAGRDVDILLLAADGGLRCGGPDGWRTGTLLPGSFRLGNVAWLRLACGGGTLGELITRGNSGAATWRRFCVVWRYRARHDSGRGP